jgi:hypothetical protein
MRVAILLALAAQGALNGAVGYALGVLACKSGGWGPC